MEGVEADCPPVEPAPMEVVQEPPPPTEPAHTEPGYVELPPPVQPPLHMEPISKKSPRKDGKKEKPNMQSEGAHKERVLIEVGLVPVKDSQVLKESTEAQALSAPSPLPREKEEESGDQNSLSDGPGNTEGPLQKEGAEEADESIADGAAAEESSSVSASVLKLSLPKCETSDGEYQTHSDEACEMEMVTDESATENLPAKGAALEEPASPSLFSPSVEEQDAVSKTTLPLAPAPVSVTVNESQETDEDEGIHSHDGSDLSDNMSEGSDDSGLHGARPVPQETSAKNAKEALPVKVAEGDFVCIFCDHSFRKEKGYSKHLNRHLVNVYFLEKAAKGQE
ncbi:RE1-silencing transcription factor-like [Heterocephalus glaber]|uniref:RE1-silencing transcription factor-like n=1 Tax=Heterocephalus glaber TaxID=10181 RepID=A0AAX6SLQ9_HETGA|nr:RE1-silencing transcription factor-like [Heterocephalus glaber]